MISAGSVLTAISRSLQPLVLLMKSLIPPVSPPPKKKVILDDIQLALPIWVTPTVNSTMTTPVLNNCWDKSGTNQIIDSPVSIELRDMTSSTRISVLAGTYIVTIAALVIKLFSNNNVQQYIHKYIHWHISVTLCS